MAQRLLNVPRIHSTWRCLAGLLLVLGAFSGCSTGDGAEPATMAATGTENARTAVFAGGCFWCMEPPFDALDGVLATTSGYAGGSVANPSYKAVTGGGTGHLEVVQVTYDPERVSYEALLAVFWRNVDPLDAGGQFCDRGDSYRTAIFTSSDSQLSAAQASAAEIAAQFDQPVATQVLSLARGNFYPAEDYHQDYYRKNPVRYKFYRSRCGRDARLEAVWGSDAT